MRRSASKILTTHVGSLPFLTLDRGVAIGDDTRLAEDVTAVVARQREIGIDIVNEGEYAKGGDWLRYMLEDRFGGFTEIDEPEGKPLSSKARIARSSPTSTNMPTNAAHCSTCPARRSPRSARSRPAPGR